MQKYGAVVLFFICLSIYGQESVLNGIVVDENNIPLPGATVQMQGSQDGVITDLRFLTQDMRNIFLVDLLTVSFKFN